MAARSYRGWGDFKSSELNGHLSKDKLCRVQCHPISVTNVEPLGSLKECFLDRVRPHQGVIHALGLSWDVRHKLIEAVTVVITEGNVYLGGNTIAIAAPRCDECGKVVVVLM